MRNRNHAFEEWIAAARAVRVQDELMRRGLWSRAMAGDNGVPCPGCGGRDRFAVNTRKNVWLCRASGEGGDAIALAMHLDGTEFLAAVETITGQPPPDRASRLTESERRAIAARVEEATANEDAKRREQDADSAWFRERERRAAYVIWQSAKPISGTAAEDYLTLRKLTAPPGARLRFLETLSYWNKPKCHGGQVVHEGPAMLAAIEGPHGRFSGVHQTWIDLSKPKGKAAITDPATGDFLPAKKVRGSIKGGSILLGSSLETAEFPGDRQSPARLFLGEGIETALAVFLRTDGEIIPSSELACGRRGVSLGCEPHQSLWQGGRARAASDRNAQGCARPRASTLRARQ